jgi:long-chain acyl-CoA synthetase
MDHFAWQFGRFDEAGAAPALVWGGGVTTYKDLKNIVLESFEQLVMLGVEAGDCVGVAADYSPSSVGLLLALLKRRAILVPLARGSRDQHATFSIIAELDHLLEVDVSEAVAHTLLGERRGNPLLETLRNADAPGLILFTSGSSGRPKAVVHALEGLLAKFRAPRRAWRTVSFLLFDHIGGLNTLFYTLANLGCTVVPQDRSVDAVCRAIEHHRAELLPTTPSFLNLLLMQDAQERFDLSSIQRITYGTEVMPARTLDAANRAFPGVRFQQTYGLSEVGILRSASQSDSSLLVKIGGEDYQTRVVDGRLQIRARTSMLGYLNAASPFDAAGWLDTGDVVQQAGDYYRILGRESDVINVGGQKVSPDEVEQVLANLPGVIEAVVYGEEHAILGQIVAATLHMNSPTPTADIRRRVAAHCRGRLQPFMVPQKVRVVSEPLLSDRFKKLRQ